MPCPQSPAGRILGVMTVTVTLTEDQAIVVRAITKATGQPTTEVVRRQVGDAFLLMPDEFFRICEKFFLPGDNPEDFCRRAADAFSSVNGGQVSEKELEQSVSRLRMINRFADVLRADGLLDERVEGGGETT